MTIGTHILSVFILQPQLNRRGPGLPGGSVVESTCQSRGHGFDPPSPGRSHMLQGS